MPYCVKVNIHNFIDSFYLFSQSRAFLFSPLFVCDLVLLFVSVLLKNRQLVFATTFGDFASFSSDTLASYSESSFDQIRTPLSFLFLFCLSVCSFASWFSSHSRYGDGGASSLPILRT